MGLGTLCCFIGFLIAIDDPFRDTLVTVRILLSLAVGVGTLGTSLTSTSVSRNGSSDNALFTGTGSVDCCEKMGTM